MSDKSKIEWTDSTWNPATGCTKVSPGCAHCYIERTPPFRINHRKFDQWTGRTGVQLHPERLEQPLHWKRPRRIFVNSLSDLFHEAIPTEFILKVFEIMACASEHTFQILTKRPERMLRLLGYSDMMTCDSAEHHRLLCTMPLPNVWLGVTAENQRFADHRIPLLLRTPAVKRFVSYEPSLGPLDLEPFLGPLPEDGDGAPYPGRLNWIICGGESGPGARPMDLAWARSVRDQCRAAGVPFFMKQICDSRGRKISFEQWPEDLRVRELPQ